MLRAGVARRACRHAECRLAPGGVPPRDSPLLGDFIARLWSAVPVEAIWRSRRAKQSLAQHEEIMDAVLRGDAAAARDLMREHIEYGVKATLEQLGQASSDAPERPGLG